MSRDTRRNEVPERQQFEIKFKTAVPNRKTAWVTVYGETAEQVAEDYQEKHPEFRVLTVEPKR
jgi:hypothetical protein